MAAGALVIKRLFAGTTRGMQNGTFPPTAPRTRLTLTADPAVDARDTTISLCCRVRSGSAEPIAGGLLRFVLPPEIRIGAEESAALVLPPIEPFGETTIVRSVTVHPASGDAIDLRFEAVLTLGAGQLDRSNVALVRISRAARLNGPDTVVTLRPGARHGEIVVEAQIVNAGNAAARDLIVAVPPPAGTVSMGPLADTVFTLAQLGPGESHTFAYAALLTATTLRSVAPSEATVRASNGTHLPLAAGPPLSLAAELQAPSVEVTPSGRRLQVAVRGVNAGAGRADDVALRLYWPAAFVCMPPSLAWNGARVGDADDRRALARAMFRPDGVDLRVAWVDAGETYELRCDLHATGAATAGNISVDVGPAGSAVRTNHVLEWRPLTDVRLRIAEAPSTIESGTCARLVAELVNAGDGDCTVNLDVAGTTARVERGDPSAAPDGGIALAAGAWRRVAVELDMPPSLHDGGALALTLSARTNGMDVAHAAFALRARNRAAVGSRAWWASGSAARQVVLPPRVTRPPVDRAAERPAPAAPATGGGFGLAKPVMLESACAPSEATPVTLGIWLDAAALDACVRILRNTPTANPFAHLCSLRALLPTDADSADPSLTGAVAAARAALEALLERLAIKLRIAHRRPSLRDCDDATTRRLVTELLSAIARGAGRAGARADQRLRLESHIDPRWAQRQIAQIGAAQPGDAPSLSAAVGLLPTWTSGSAALSAALSAYVQTLHAALLAAGAGTDDAAGSFDAARERLVTELLKCCAGASTAMDVGRLTSSTPSPAL